ncbi:hypothetical protein EcWSU1_02324 [Enterobacter ludwigii]|uniref:Uncharacterized protein n=1 Tax=Enterobacter ludwigii TaxID=299767 RepID=G8LCC7_9ENTR|nr:hypothetical protein EcWSU1_02324 [Enterobacter ludwigii]
MNVSSVNRIEIVMDKNAKLNSILIVSNHFL